VKLPRVRGRSGWVLLGLIGAAAVFAASVWRSAAMHELTDMGEFKGRFNEDQGVARLVLLLSPT
jgi:hypothetical protein